MLNKFLASSIDPEKLSLTVKGILVGLIPLALIVFPEITQIELQGAVDGIVNVIISVSIAISALATLMGALRKIVVKIMENK